jgi:hypothetical protein
VRSSKRHPVEFYQALYQRGELVDYCTERLEGLMSGRMHHATLPITAKELDKILRKWGWSIKTSTGKHNTWTKGESTITVRRVGGKENPTWEPVRIAAKVEGITADEWLKGPPEEVVTNHAPLSEGDIDFFMNYEGPRTEDARDRWNNIRYRMRREGTLAKWTAAREAQRKFPAGTPFEPAHAVASAPEPIPEDETITLAQALAKVNAKETQLYHKTIRMLVELQLGGDVRDENGRCTRLLAQRLGVLEPTTNELSHFSTLIKKLADAGLVHKIDRGNARKTFCIFLTKPISLTEDQISKWATIQPGADEQSDNPPELPPGIRPGKIVPLDPAGKPVQTPQEPVAASEPEPEAQPEPEAPAAAEPRQLHVERRDAEGEPIPGSRMTLDEARLLAANPHRAALDVLYNKLDELRTQITAIEYAIHTLEGN